MWPRVAETALGAWLLVSPFVFRHTTGYEPFAAVDLAAGAAAIVLALASFWPRTAWAHLVTIPLAAGLGLFAYLGFERPGPPGAQNEIVVALMLLTFAIVPNEANAPPVPWRRRRGAGP
jgi:hypothetical protein